VLAGEARCVRVPDFELGNSPASLAAADRAGEELVLATTNGSPAVVAAAHAAERVLVGCLLNLRAVRAAVPRDAAVAIVCAGTNGRPALEDVYVAGRLVSALGGVPSDAARVAERVASGYGTPLEPLDASEDAAQLRATGQGRDIAWCARESVHEIVPEVWSVGDGASMVGLAENAYIDVVL
jgi:2-phosphosulfolactate phosphatase